MSRQSLLFSAALLLVAGAPCAALPTATGFLTYNSTAGALGETQVNNLTAGVTVQMTVTDAVNGLAISSMSLAFSGDGHDGQSTAAGYGVMYTTTAGHSWINWSTYTVTALGGGQTTVQSMAVFNGRLYAGSSSGGQIYSSADGVNWGTPVLSTGENVILALAAFGGQLYAGTFPSGKIYRTPDGTTWTQVLSGTGESQIDSLTVFGGKLYAGTSPNGKIFSSPDGTTWSTALSGSGEATIQSLAAFGGKLYAGTVPNGKIYASPDGSSWTQNFSGTGENQVNALAAFNGKLYAGTFPSGKIYSSPDGTTWTQVLSGTGENVMVSMTAYNGRLYAGTNPDGMIYSSADGVTWAQVLSSVGEIDIQSMTSFNGDLIAGAFPGGNVIKLSPLSVTLTGTDGTTSAQTLSATSLYLAASTNTSVCGGVSPCGATNQIMFAAADTLGNVRSAGPFAVIADTYPVSLVTSLTSPTKTSLLADATGQDTIGESVVFNYTASSSPVFAAPISSSNFISATYYLFTGLVPATTYFVTVTARDQILNTGFPSPVASTQTLGDVAWTATDIAPPGIFQSSEAAVMRFTLQSLSGSAPFRKLQVTRTGGSDADVAQVRVYLDSAGNGIYNSNDTLLGQNFLTGGSALVDLGGNFQTIGVAVSTFFVVYLAAPQATIGAAVSASVDVSSNVFLSYPFQAVGAFPAASSFAVVQATGNVLSVSTQTVAPASAPPGSLNVPMIGLKMKAPLPGGSAILHSLVAYLHGTLPSNQVTSVRVYRDNGNGFLDGGDALLTSGNDTFVSGVSTIVFTAAQSSLTVTAAPALFFVTANLSLSAPPGDSFSISLATASEMVLTTAIDTVSYSTTPISSPVVNVVNNNALTASLAGNPPATMRQGSAYQVAAATLNVNVGFTGVTGLVVNRTGAGVDADVAAVQIWAGDASDNGAFNPFTDTLAGSAVFSGGIATVNLSTANITAGATTVMFVVYDIAAGANPGDTLGASFSNVTYVQTNNALTSVIGNFPYVTSTGTVLATVNTLLSASIDQSPGSLLQGATNVSLLRLQLWSDQNSLKLSSLQLNRLGVGLNADVSAVSIWRDADGNGILSTSTDTLVTSGADLMPVIGTTTVAFTIPQTITPTTATYFVAVNVSPNSAPGNSIGVRVSSTVAFSVNVPNIISTTSPTYPLSAGPAPISQYPNVVTVSTASLTPVAGANPGAQNVALASLTLNANVSTAQWLSLRVDRGGTASDLDVDAVKVWYDINQIGSFDASNLGQYLLVTSSTLTFGGEGTPGSILLGFNAPQGLTTTPKTFFLTVDIATGAVTGGTVVARAIDQTYFAVNSPNSVAQTSFSAAPLTIAAPPSLLQTVFYSSAPLSAIQGTANVAMESIGIWMRAYTGLVSSIVVSRTGSGQDADVTRVRLYSDTNLNGVLDPATDVELATAAFAGGTASLSFTPLTVTGTTQTLFVAYDVSPTAIFGDTLGASIPTPGSISIAAPNSVSGLGFPLATSTMTTVIPTENGVAMSFQDRSPANLLQGTTNVLMLALSMNTTSHVVLASALAFDRLGTAADTDISRLRVYFDNVGDGVFRPATNPQIVSVSTPFVSGRALVSLLPAQLISPPPAALYFVAVDAANFADSSKTFGLTLASTASVSVNLPNTVVNANFPMSSSIIPITKVPDVLTITPASLLLNNVIQGSLVPALTFTASSSRELSTWTQLILGRTGSLSDALITQVQVYRDLNGSGVIVSSDPVIGVGTFSGGIASIVFSSAQTVGISTQNYIVALQLNANATVGASLGLTLANLTAFTISAPDSAASPSLPFQTASVTVLDAHTPTQPTVVTTAGAYSSDFEEISFVWSSSVAIGSLTSAVYAIGTTPGGTQLRPFTAIVPVPGGVTAGGLLLSSGSTYYVTVQATSSFGFTSVPGVAAGQLVDTVSPGQPLAPNLAVGLSSVVMTWATVTSGPSGLRGYLVEYQTRSHPSWINGVTGTPTGLMAVEAAGTLPAASLAVTAPVALSNLPNGTLSFRVTAISNAGIAGTPSPTTTVQFGPLDKNALDNASVFPNPVDSRKGSATIVFDLPAAASVSVDVYTLFGTKAGGFSASGTAGTNAITWDATATGGAKLPKGVYILVLQSSGKTVKLKAGVIH